MIHLLSLFYFALLVFYANGDERDATKCETSKTCGDCVSSLSCYWCTNHDKCYDYKVQQFSTYFEHCNWGESRWKFCWLNVMALVISLSVIGGIVFIAFIVCCCWCSYKCRQRRQRHMEREESESRSKEEERKMKREEKKVEHDARNDAVRAKYGLLKEENH